jgi:hypothetical protein
MVIALGLFCLYNARIKRASQQGVRCVFKSQDCVAWCSIKIAYESFKRPTPGFYLLARSSCTTSKFWLGFEGCRN